MINVHHQNQDHAELMNISIGVEINALKANVAAFNPMDIIALLTREALLALLFVSYGIQGPSSLVGYVARIFGGFVYPYNSHDVNAKLDTCVMTSQEVQHTDNVLQ